MTYSERLHIKPHIYLVKGKWRVAYSVKTPMSVVMAAVKFRDNRNYPTVTAEIFEQFTGYKPEWDDLERCNCPKAGLPGHLMCGWDALRNMPLFIPGDSNGTPSN